MLLGPAQQSGTLKDCCAGPRSRDKSSSQRDLQLSATLKSRVALSYLLGGQ